MNMFICVDVKAMCNFLQLYTVGRKLSKTCLYTEKMLKSVMRSSQSLCLEVGISLIVLTCTFSSLFVPPLQERYQNCTVYLRCGQTKELHKVSTNSLLLQLNYRSMQVLYHFILFFLENLKSLVTKTRKFFFEVALSRA